MRFGQHRSLLELELTWPAKVQSGQERFVQFEITRSRPICNFSTSIGRGFLRNRRRAVADRPESAKLGDMSGLELLEAGDSEEAHGSFDLLREDLDRSIDPCSAAGHQSVQVGPTDHGQARTEGNTGDDVSARHDSGVDVHLDVGADLADDLWQQV